MARASRPLRDVIAQGAQKARLQVGLRQDDAAARMRANGLPSWLRGTVAQVEVGARRVSVDELLLLALAYDTTPAGLLHGADDDLVELSPTVRLPLGALRALLTGHVVEAGEINRSTHEAADLADEIDGLRDDARRFGLSHERDVARALVAIGDTERNAARSLGTTPEQLNFAAVGRWGRTLAEERDHRVSRQLDRPLADAPPRQVQALRGHVTRELVAELRITIEKHRDTSP